MTKAGEQPTIDSIIQDICELDNNPFDGMGDDDVWCSLSDLRVILERNFEDHRTTSLAAQLDKQAVADAVDEAETSLLVWTDAAWNGQIAGDARDFCRAQYGRFKQLREDLGLPAYKRPEFQERDLTIVQTSLAAQDMVKQWEDEWTATHDDHWGDQIAWATAREIARRIDEARPTSSLAAQDGLDDFDPALCPSCRKEDFDGCDDCGNCPTCCKCGAQDGLVEAAGVFPRIVTHEQALDAARNFIDAHFNNKDGKGVLTGIPARPDHDDLLLTDYIRQQRALSAIKGDKS